jgi:TRAP-type mannitol/chloroaromatic compound transport system permease small subunit
MDRVIRFLERISELSGRTCAWLILVMVGLVAYDVAMRYLFQAGSVALQELEWHLFGMVFLLCAAYTLKHDGHVRVDVIYRSRRIPQRWRAWIDLFGSLFLLLPFCALVIWASWPFVADAFRYQEHSPDPGGLPYRWLLKACIPLGFLLLMLEGVAMSLRSLKRLRDR